MAVKLVFPPQLSGAEALLDLLANPQDFQARLQALQEAEDRVKQRLGDLQTKEEADAYMHQARVAVDAAKAVDARLDERDKALRAAQAMLTDKAQRIQAILAE